MANKRREEVCVKECRICQDSTNSTEALIKPCSCNGTIGYVHVSCLSQWIKTNKEEICRICSTPFDVKSVKVGHNFWKYLHSEDNRLAFIGTVLLNALSVLFTFAFLTLLRITDIHGLHYYWFIVISILTANLCILALVVQSWFTLHSSFKYWQRRNFDIVLVKN